MLSTDELHELRRQALADVTRLLRDDQDARHQLSLLRADYARLLRAARAAIAAERAGAPDPLTHIRHLLAERGQLPPCDMRSPQLLAEPHPLRAAAEVTPS